MKYELILFDADNTLFDFDKTEEIALKRLIESIDSIHTDEFITTTYKDINTTIWKEFENGLISSNDIKVERFSRLVNELNLEICPKELSTMYLTYLGEGSYIYEDTFSLLPYLSEKYRLAIITNGLTEVQNNRIKKSKISHYFEEVVISDEIKIAKPDPKIFDYTLSTLNHNNKDSVLMIGDSLNSDIKGGQNFSIDTCWVNFNKKENRTNVTPTYEISSLLQLKDLI